MIGGHEGSGIVQEVGPGVDWLEPGVLVAVEWADRLPEALPADRLEVRLSRPDAAADPASRTLHATALGATAQAALERWRDRLAAAGSG